MGSHAFLGKTANDMYIVGHERSRRVTRSIKRIYSDMQQHLVLYQRLQVMSWMFEGTLGTRLRPGMPKVPAPPGIAIGGEGIPASEEALAVFGHVDDGSESDRELPGIDITDGGLPVAAKIPPLSANINKLTPVLLQFLLCLHELLVA